MSDLAFYVAVPSLLFASLVRAENLHIAGPTGAFLVISLMIYALGMGLVMTALRRPFAPAAVAGLNAAFGNAVMMGIPIVVAAFGTDALVPLLGIITIHSAVILPLAPILIEFGSTGDGGTATILRATTIGLSRTR